MSRLNPGRLAAGRALLAVERGAHAEDMLAELSPPPGPDRGLAWNITLGVLRRRGALAHMVNPFLRRPLHKLDPAPRIALLVGTFEAALTRAPLHAAVDQAVELTRKLRAPHTAGLVNAVLRKAARVPVPDDPFLDLPRWLAQRWADAPGWVTALQNAPNISVCTVDGRPPTGIDVRPAVANGAPVPGVFTVLEPAGTIESWPGYAAGRWWVMDPAAAAVADLVGTGLGGDLSGMRVLDACAAPGGKSYRLACAGATVIAVDQDSQRLERLTQGAARLQRAQPGLSIEARTHDWRHGAGSGASGGAADWGGEERFDAVLVDAPCTGLGVVRRHPEIKWRRMTSDPAAMALQQRPIVEAAATMVREGGRLVYAVCSPMAEEGEAVATSLAGWVVTSRWINWPPGDEDAFQAFVLERS